MSGFLFLYFYFCFLQKYIFDLEIYRNIPGRPDAGRPGPGRPAARRQGLERKKKKKKNCRQVPGAGRPAAGRPAPPGRPAAGRAAPGHPIKGVCPVTPIWLTKNLQKKEERGRERRGEGEAKWRSPVGFSRRRLQVTKSFYIL